MRQQRLRPGLIGLAVLLAHGLLWLWLGAEGRRAVAPEPTSLLISLHLIAEKPPQARPAPAPAQPPRRSTARPQLALPTSAVPAIESNAITPPAPILATAAASAAALTASAPRPALLLDSEATRRAVQQAARNAPLTAAAPAETAQQRLGREIGESATGDCLKGEFAGGGMGLLSAPFWLLAEARGKCRR